MFNGVWNYIKQFVGESDRAKKSNIKKRKLGEKNKSDFSLMFEHNDPVINKKLDELDDQLHCGKTSNIASAARYLYENGYKNKDLKFLGEGSFNVVFRIGDTDRIVKYCKSFKDPRYPGAAEGVSVDEMSMREFEKMLNNIKDAKLKKWAEKYLSKVKRKNNKDIYESDLATGDLQNITVNKRNDVLQQFFSKNKSLDSLLKKAKNIAKSILVLHENGYVHQDIKPANILQLPNPKYLDADHKTKNKASGKDKYGKYTVISETSEEDNKIRYFKKYETGSKREKSKISKNTINLADYGLMRKIEGEIGSPQSEGTPAFMGKDDRKIAATNAEDVMKRDVYALGITFFALLCGRYPEKVTSGEGLKYEISGLSPCIVMTDEDKIKIKEWFDEKSLFHNTLCTIYNPGEETRLLKFIKLIDNMTCKRQHRCLLPAVIQVIKKLEGKKPKD